MPFHAIQRNGEWIVENAHTHDVKGHHGKDKAKAERQVRALYANSSDVKKKSAINPQLMAAFLQQLASDTAFKITPRDVINNQLLSAILPDVATQNIILNGQLRLAPAVNGGSPIQNAIHRNQLIDSYMERYPNSMALLDQKLLELLALQQVMATQQLVPANINEPGAVDQLIDQLAAIRSL